MHTPLTQNTSSGNLSGRNTNWPARGFLHVCSRKHCSLPLSLLYPLSSLSSPSMASLLPFLLPSQALPHSLSKPHTHFAQLKPSPGQQQSPEPWCMWGLPPGQPSTLYLSFTRYLSYPLPSDNLKFPVYPFPPTCFLLLGDHPWEVHSLSPTSLFHSPTHPWGTPPLSLWTEDPSDTSLPQVSFSASQHWPVLSKTCITPTSCTSRTFSAQLQSLSPGSDFPPIFTPWQSGFCSCFHLKPPGKLAFSSELHSLGDLFCMHLTGTFWRHLAQLVLRFLRKRSSPRALWLHFLLVLLLLWPWFSVSFSDSCTSYPLQTQVLGSRKVWLCSFLFSPQKPFRGFTVPPAWIILTFPLHHSYSSFKTPPWSFLEISPEPLGRCKCTPT